MAERLLGVLTELAWDVVVILDDQSVYLVEVFNIAAVHRITVYDALCIAQARCRGGLVDGGSPWSRGALGTLRLFLSRRSWAPWWSGLRPVCLVTGFEWFEVEGVVYEPNPSGVAAESLDGVDLGVCRVEGVSLPVEPGALDMLRRLLLELDPVAVVSAGLYTPGTRWLRLEVVAVNALRWRGGLRRLDSTRPLFDPVPAPVDVVAVSEGLSGAGFEARPSASIGLFMCNAVAYTVYRWGWEAGRPALFIHTPLSTRLAERLGVGGPSVPEWLIRGALLEALRLVARAARVG